MFYRLSKKSSINRILIVSLTNLGDVVLTCPVIDVCRRDFPQARIDVVIGPSAVSLFEGNPHLRAVVFDKQASLVEKAKWFFDLYRRHYEVVVDLRNTMLPFLLMPRYATTFAWGNQHQGHMREKHLNRLRSVYEFEQEPSVQYAIVTTPQDERFFKSALTPFLGGQPFVVIAPGALDSAKRWPPQGFAAVADQMAGQYKIIFVATAQEAAMVEDIQRQMKTPCLSLAGKINLRQLAYLLKKCSWALAHDSGVMHIAGYLNVPLVALWGPTEVSGSAPWSSKAVVVRRNDNCPRCRNPRSLVAHNCMAAITVEDVLEAIKMLNS